jgi:hypothetical protein
MQPPRRVALVFDDEQDRRRFVDHLGPRALVYHGVSGDDLLKHGSAGAIDVAVCGVINRNDHLLPSALRRLSRVAPQIRLVGVCEPSPPSLDEAVELIREIPAMGFVSRPGGRFDYLVRRPASYTPAATFTAWLLDCMERLPLFGHAHRFAILQALHPSIAASIPEQARDLGLSRRNLERWFQGPDLCSAGCFQSVCGAAEAAYLRLILGVPTREVALATGILTQEGMENPQAVPRTVRNALRVGFEDLRGAGVAGLLEVVETALRTPREPVRPPAQWEPDARYLPALGVIAVPVEGRVMLMNPSREVRFPLDQLGLEAWPMVARGVAFGELVGAMTAGRSEPASSVRARLIAWLGELLVLRLIRRERGHLKAANGD